MFCYYMTNRETMSCRPNYQLETQSTFNHLSSPNIAQCLERLTGHQKMRDDMMRASKMRAPGLTGDEFESSKRTTSSHSQQYNVPTLIILPNIQDRLQTNESETKHNTEKRHSCASENISRKFQEYFFAKITSSSK